jgi:hypothetical protein
MENKELTILIVACIISLIVGGLIGYYAIPRKEGYRYASQPTPTMLDLRGLGAKSNGYISQPYVGIEARGDHINRFSLQNSEARARRVKSSKMEAYAAPSYGLVNF